MTGAAIVAAWLSLRAAARALGAMLVRQWVGQRARLPLPIIAAAVGACCGLAAALLGIHPALGFLAGVTALGAGVAVVLTVLLLADWLTHKL